MSDFVKVFDGSGLLLVIMPDETTLKAETMVLFAQIYIFKGATFSDVVEKLALENKAPQYSGVEIKRMMAVDRCIQAKKGQTTSFCKQAQTGYTFQKSGMWKTQTYKAWYVSLS